MKKIVLLIAYALLTCFSSKASHIIGGEFSVQWMGGNTYHIRLNHYRDCLSPVPFQNPIPVGIYDYVTNTVVDTFCMTLGDSAYLSLGDSCYHPDPTQICVQLGIYDTTITFSGDPSRLYYIAYSRCCRNANISNIVNPGGTGEVWYTEFSLNNSSPQFGAYPKGYMCVDDINIQTFAATDADNDSLVYSLATPLSGDLGGSTPELQSICTGPVLNAKNMPDPGPYDSVVWQAPYSATNMVGGSPAMSIDPRTGILTAVPPDLGIFVFCVVVQEYSRSTKQKLGEVRRDVQYEMLACKGATVPEFTSPDSSSYTIVSGNSVSFPVTVRDPNDSSDVNYLTADSVLYSKLFINGNTASFSPASGVKLAQSTFTYNSVCGETGTYEIKFQDLKKGCFGQLNFYDSTYIVVVPPPDILLDTVPNIFTPNGDKLNDNLTLYHIADRQSMGALNCWTNFDIKIFDRWGVLQYESTDLNFAWNGNNKSGDKVSEGVYYYMITADFLGKPATKRGTVNVKL